MTNSDIHRHPIENGKSVVTTLALPGGGGYLWCVASAPDTRQDFEGQTKQVLASLEKLIADGGGNLSRILKAEIVVTNHDNKPLFDALWREWIPDSHGPVRSFVESRMPEGDLVEAILTVALPTS